MALEQIPQNLQRLGDLRALARVLQFLCNAFSAKVLPRKLEIQAFQLLDTLASL